MCQCVLAAVCCVLVVVGRSCFVFIIGVSLSTSLFASLLIAVRRAVEFGCVSMVCLVVHWWGWLGVLGMRLVRERIVIL